MSDINWSKVGIGALLVVAFCALQVQFQGTSNTLEKITTKNSELEQTLNHSIDRVRQLDKAVTTLLQEEASSEESLSKERVSERFDRLTGKLVQRTRTSTSSNKISHTAVKQSTVASTKEIEVQKEVKQVVSKETVKETEVVTLNNSRTGFAVGLLTTSRGVGPALSYGLLSIKNKANVDIVAGAVNTGGIPDPKLGVAISGEVLPRLTVGLGGYLTGPGENVAAYHPALPVIGITPGMTVQYRF